MALSPINPGRRIDQNQHLNHEHPMMKVQRKNDGHIICCDGCGDPVLGPSYTCNICGFDLHKSCAELPAFEVSPWTATAFSLAPLGFVVSSCKGSLPLFRTGLALHSSRVWPLIRQKEQDFGGFS